MINERTRARDLEKSRAIKFPGNCFPADDLSGAAAAATLTVKIKLPPPPTRVQASVQCP